PYVSGRQLVYEAQTEAGLAAEFCLVAVADDQFLLLPPSDAFLRRVEWNGNVAAAWRPAANDSSSVRISPTMRFGRPAVGGVSTETIWEQVEADEEIDTIAEVYQVSVSDVRWALAYENSRRAA
ncbi:MAG: DUF433 domain-containing protein, partial [Pseudonocardia sp.]